jgi:hypothetical protein
MLAVDLIALLSTLHLFCHVLLEFANKLSVTHNPGKGLLRLYNLDKAPEHPAGMDFRNR